MTGYFQQILNQAQGKTDDNMIKPRPRHRFENQKSIIDSGNGELEDDVFDNNNNLQVQAKESDLKNQKEKNDANKYSPQEEGHFIRKLGSDISFPSTKLPIDISLYSQSRNTENSGSPKTEPNTPGKKSIRNIETEPGKRSKTSTEVNQNFPSNAPTYLINTGANKKADAINDDVFQKTEYFQLSKKAAKKGLNQPRDELSPFKHNNKQDLHEEAGRRERNRENAVVIYENINPTLTPKKQTYRSVSKKQAAKTTNKPRVVIDKLVIEVVEQKQAKANDNFHSRPVIIKQQVNQQSNVKSKYRFGLGQM